MHRNLSLHLMAWTLVIGLLAPHSASAQTADNTSDQQLKVTFREYLEAVATHSLDLQTERQNITSARADVSLAGVRPDPELNFGIDSAELDEANKPNASLATLIELGYTLETAGKRHKRIQVAESKLKLVEAQVAAFLRQLGLDAASAFIEACRTRDALGRKQSSLRSFQELVRATEIRFKAGDVSRLELWQTNVEADRFASEVTTATAEAQAAKITLSTFLGKPFGEVFPGAVVDSVLKREPFEINLDTCIQKALTNRIDIRVAEREVESSRHGVQLAQANRWVDPKLNLSLTNTPRVDPIYNGEGSVTNAPAERSLALGLTITVPIPFSRLQKGELIQAETALSQAQLRLSSTRLKAETEVRATFAKYQAAFENIRRYREHVLKDSDRVMEGMQKAYRMGSASFLELLNAQRTADDVYLGYYQAIADLANATVKLQISAGLRPDL
jgi:cobalt-zinc-cadmium efflux system outer membrane protein